ncbi:MAG: hypothetical protein LUF85_15000 [Bacteroides sp.]|nr:hypothetical protein [Bacteroides sp.]
MKKLFLCMILSVAGIQMGYSQKIRQFRWNEDRYTLEDKNGVKTGELRRSVWNEYKYTILDRDGSKTGVVERTTWNPNKYIIKDTNGSQLGTIKIKRWNKFDVYDASGTKTGFYKKKTNSNEWTYRNY